MPPKIKLDFWPKIETETDSVWADRAIEPANPASSVAQLSPLVRHIGGAIRSRLACGTRTPAINLHLVDTRQCRALRGWSEEVDMIRSTMD